MWDKNLCSTIHGNISAPEAPADDKHLLSLHSTSAATASGRLVCVALQGIMQGSLMWPSRQQTARCWPVRQTMTPARSGA